IAGEEVAEERVVAQLGWLEHRLAAAIGRAEKDVPLLARARPEQRIHLRNKRAFEAAIGPRAPADGRAESLPELRLQRAESVPAAVLAGVHPIAGERPVEHVLRGVRKLAQVREQK